MKCLQAGILLFLFSQCTAVPSPKKQLGQTANKPTKKAIVLPKTTIVITENGLVALNDIAPAILVDLKYTSTDNFMHKQLYHSIGKAYLVKEVAERLANCQELLSKLKPGYHLLVYDATRPVSVQQEMWESLDSIPYAERIKFVSNPKNGSLHNYGAAVDLTIANEKGETLDMGAGFDDIRLIAYPENEAHFLQTGELTTQHAENRRLLRKVMQSQGFRNLPTEWWHFNACSRNEAKKKYILIKNEEGF
jgi:D-alanyl-D-alanine dipeptidase